MAVADFIRDWWPLAFTVLGGIGGWWLTMVSRQTKSVWRIEQLEKVVTNLDHEVEHLKTVQSKSDINMQVLEVTLRQIKDILSEIRADLRGKADKPDR